MATTMIASCSAAASVGASRPRAARTAAPAALSSARPVAAPLVAARAERVQVAARRAAVTVSAAAPEAPSAGSSTETKTWYALVANANFMLNDVQNEPLAEQLREKVRFYKEQDKELDFFLVCEPEWLDALPESNKVGRPAVALVSPDKVWITFMKLRLDRVLKVELGEATLEDVTRCGAPVPDFPEPEKWTAPYSAYSKGWWEVFMPGLKK